MKDTMNATVLKIYDRTSFLVSVNSVDVLSQETYANEEVITLKFDESFSLNSQFNRLIHLIGQEVFLITEGRDEFGRIIARYKLMETR